MVLFNAGRIEATGGKGWNLYADGATESVCKVMLAMDVERMSLLNRISSDGIAFNEAYENLYATYSLEKKTLSETLRQSPIHGDPAMLAPDAVDTRYLSEDLPFGLSPWSSIGRMWDIPTPNVDAVLQIASIMTDVDYFTEGLTVDDLGIEGMAPEEVELLVTFPIESAVNGSPGVRRLRSVSADGISVAWVEFQWGTDIYQARQVVTERLQRVDLPSSASRPELGPISSIMGEITFIAMSASPAGGVGPMELRRLAETVVRRNLLSISGISELVVIGVQD